MDTVHVLNKNYHKNCYLHLNKLQNIPNLITSPAQSIHISKGDGVIFLIFVYKINANLS